MAERCVSQQWPDANVSPRVVFVETHVRGRRPSLPLAPVLGASELGAWQDGSISSSAAPSSIRGNRPHSGRSRNTSPRLISCLIDHHHFAISSVPVAPDAHMS